MVKEYMKMCELLTHFNPQCGQEKSDKLDFQAFIYTYPMSVLGQHPEGHITVSAWVVNPAHDKVLMVHHNLYQAWTWIGGHADNNCLLHEVALQEVKEETGVVAKLLQDAPFSLELLSVPANAHKGEQEEAHKHFNFTFLMEAAEDAPLTVNTAENSSVQWRTLAEIAADLSEPHMQPIYEKLMQRVAGLDK